MEIHIVKPSHQERRLLTNFAGELCPEEIDFNWLMPVVEKIAKDGYDTYISVDGLSHNHKCVIGTTTDIYSETTGSWCLQVVHSCVTKFIKWHNEQSL